MAGPKPIRAETDYLFVDQSRLTEPELEGPRAWRGERDIEMRLGQLRDELGEVGRWAVHPNVPTSA